ISGAGLNREKSHQQQRRQNEQDNGLEGPPASCVGLREGIDEHSKGECDRGTPRKVEPFLRSSALGQEQWRESNGGKADGELHEEHPAPTECARQESAQNDA